MRTRSTAMSVWPFALALVIAHGVKAQVAGNALLFDGANDLATIADSASLHLASSATIEAWIRPTTPFSMYQRLINKGDGGGCASDRAYELTLAPPGSLYGEGVES